MKAKVINEGPERTIALIFDRGDEVIANVERFANDHGLSAARFTAIGAFEQVTLGYFDWERKDYERIAFDEQLEVLSLIGDVALDGTKAIVHARACGPPSKCCWSSRRATCGARAIRPVA